MYSCLAHLDRSLLTSTARTATRCQRGFVAPNAKEVRERLGRLCATMTVSEVSNAVMDVVRVPMFDNNYGWILRDRDSGTVAAVDPAEPDAIQKALEERSWKLDYILNTHHHADHTGGNSYLKDAYSCKIVGPSADAARIPLIDEGVGDGDFVEVGKLRFQVFDTPGHTRGHITFWQEEAAALFPGDTLFALGCGRLFEGSPEQMWASLSKFKKLPEDTAVFCAHEYTQANARWAVTVDPENATLQERKQKIDSMREQGVATIPSILGEEFATNPFLRPDNAGIRVALGVPSDASDVVAFTAIRKHKDSF